MSASNGRRPGHDPAARAASRLTASLTTLVGSGDRIARFTLPFLAVGLALQALTPSRLAVRGTSAPLRAIALAVLSCGVAMWAWSVALILTQVPRGRLITSGPYALVKHPLYTGVALLVLPALGYLRHTWLGVLIGLGVYAGSRRYAPEEEAELSTTFGADWDAYGRSVLLPWL